MKLTIYGKQEIGEDLDSDKKQGVAFMEMAVKKVVLDKATGEKEYKMENLGEVIIKEGEKVIRAKAKDNTAQKLRGRFWGIHNEKGLTEDFEDFYNRKKGELLVKLDEIYEQFLND